MSPILCPQTVDTVRPTNQLTLSHLHLLLDPCFLCWLQVEYEPRPFPKWESYWVHMLHPVFFGYSAEKPAKRREKEADEEGAIPYGIQVNERMNE